MDSAKQEPKMHPIMYVKCFKMSQSQVSNYIQSPTGNNMSGMASQSVTSAQTQGVA